MRPYLVERLKCGVLFDNCAVVMLAELAHEGSSAYVQHTCSNSNSDSEGTRSWIKFLYLRNLGHRLSAEMPGPHTCHTDMLRADPLHCVHLQWRW